MTLSRSVKLCLLVAAAILSDSLPVTFAVIVTLVCMAGHDIQKWRNR